MSRVDPVSLDDIGRIPDPQRAPPPPPPAAPPAEPSPTRQDRRRRARAVSLAAATWVAGAVAVFGARADLATPAVMAPLALWAITITLGLAAVLRPRARGLPAPVRAVQHAIWIVPAIYAITVLITASPSGDPPLGWATIRGCLSLSAVMAAGPLLAAAVILRRSFLSASGSRGAAVGALAGLAGSFGIHVHCPIPSVDHLLAAHAPAILLGALAGAAFGRARGRI